MLLDIINRNESLYFSHIDDDDDEDDDHDDVDDDDHDDVDDDDHDDVDDDGGDGDERMKKRVNFYLFLNQSFLYFMDE